MDPDALWAKIQRLRAAGHVSKAEHLMRDLNDWIAKGGFKPAAWSRL